MDGEVNTWGQGKLSTFIRLQGCNLIPFCHYCDTKYAQDKNQGTEMKLSDIITTVYNIGCNKVTITGGEPFLQKEDLQKLCRSLLNWDFKISIETNGSIPIPNWMVLGSDLCLVVDYKLDFEDKMIEDNFINLYHDHWIKFVIQSEEDYNRAIEKVHYLRKRGCEAKISFSPCFSQGENKNLPARFLVNKLIEDKEWDIITNIQIHKIIDVK